MWPVLETPSLVLGASSSGGLGKQAWQLAGVRGLFWEASRVLSLGTPTEQMQESRK